VAVTATVTATVTEVYKMLRHNIIENEQKENEAIDAPELQAIRWQYQTIRSGNSFSSKYGPWVNVSAEKAEKDFRYHAATTASWCINLSRADDYLSMLRCGTNSNLTMTIRCPDHESEGQELVTVIYRALAVEVKKEVKS